MKARPVFIAAMQREIASVVNGWRADETLPARHIHLYWNDRAIVACAGMGAHRASLAVEAALALGPASELISVGFAGACSERFPAGSLVEPRVVVDARTGERFFISEPDTTQPLDVLVTVPVPAGIVEKERLAVGYYAAAVDMEAAVVARLARARNLPFAALKTISDEMDFELPGLGQFATRDGQFREFAFAFHAAFRPWLWKPMLTLAKSSTLAAQRLRAAIEDHIR